MLLQIMDRICGSRRLASTLTTQRFVFLCEAPEEALLRRPRSETLPSTTSRSGLGKTTMLEIVYVMFTWLIIVSGFEYSL